MKCQTRNKHHFLELLLAASLGTYNCSTQQQSSPTYAADTATDIKYDATLETSNISQPQLTDTSDTNTSDTFSSQIDTTTQIDLPTLVSQDTAQYLPQDSSIATDITTSETTTTPSNPCKTVNGYLVIPDKNLENAIKNSLGLPFDKSINYETAKTIQKLDIANAKIKSLIGLECFIELEELNATGNEIESIEPLQYLPKIKIVYLPVNKVADLYRLGNSPTLVSLDVSDNKLMDISGAALIPNLQELDVEYNQIKDPSPMANSKSLQKIFLIDNPIDYNPTSCQAMKKLQQQGTWVSGFDFTKCK